MGGLPNLGLWRIGNSGSNRLHRYALTFPASTTLSYSPAAVQTVVEPDEISIATSAIVACQSLGGAVFVSAGNTILQNRLVNGGTAGVLAQIDVGEVVNAGATRFRDIVPEELLPAFLVLYNAALQKVFYLAVGSAGMAFLATLPMEWNSVREDAKKKKPATDGLDKV